MSPTEHDLRAALRDGEGDGPDPDRLIAVGRARRTQRRMQLITTAVVVLVVGGAGTGIAALNRGGGGGADDRSSAGKLGDSATRFGATAPEGAAGSASVPPSADAAAGGTRNGDKAAAPSAAACPDTLPRYALPGGGSPGRFGADGPLFDKPVATVVVCAYGASAAAPARIDLTGAKATRLAASLNGAARTPKAACPQPVRAPSRDLAIIGRAADGSPAGTVAVTRRPGSCAAQATNGTAVRYNWTPPSDLAPRLATLPPSPGKVHGSPISS